MTYYSVVTNRNLSLYKANIHRAGTYIGDVEKETHGRLNVFLLSSTLYGYSHKGSLVMTTDVKSDYMNKPENSSLLGLYKTYMGSVHTEQVVTTPETDYVTNRTKILDQIIEHVTALTLESKDPTEIAKLVGLLDQLLWANSPDGDSDAFYSWLTKG